MLNDPTDSNSVMAMIHRMLIPVPTLFKSFGLIISELEKRPSLVGRKHKKTISWESDKERDVFHDMQHKHDRQLIHQTISKN